MSFNNDVIRIYLLIEKIEIRVYFFKRYNILKLFYNCYINISFLFSLRSETVELMTQLRTKAMREKDEVKERHFYKYSLIRIRFPDGIILQVCYDIPIHCIFHVKLIP